MKEESHFLIAYMFICRYYLSSESSSTAKIVTAIPPLTLSIAPSACRTKDASLKMNILVFMFIKTYKFLNILKNNDIFLVKYESKINDPFHKSQFQFVLPSFSGDMNY